MCVCVCVCAHAHVCYHNFPTTTNMLPHVPAPEVYTTPWTQKDYSPERLGALVAPASESVLKTSARVRSFVSSEGYVLFQTRFTGLMNNTILPASLFTFLHCKFSTEMKTSFVGCGLIKDLRAMSRFTYENISPPLTFFMSS